MDISESIMEIQELGYTVIEDFMTEDQVETARLAIEKALKTLPGKLDKSAQEKFLSQSIKNMGKN